ncbi:unnamed protein product [Laminaria digitata]
MTSGCARPQTTPPWGVSEPRVLETDSSRRRSTSRPATRTEMLRTRRQELRWSLAGDRLDPGTSEDVTPWWGGEVDWWTLAEGYRENAMENMSSSPRFQRYMSKRDRTRHAERPDPFSTHEVRIRGASKPFTEKISAANPPPKTAEAYFAPKRTIKRFTDEINVWKGRIKFQEYLDARGKNEVDDSKPLYGSPAATFTGCSLNPKVGGVNRVRVSDHHKEQHGATAIRSSVVQQRSCMPRRDSASSDPPCRQAEADSSRRCSASDQEKVDEGEGASGGSRGVRHPAPGECGKACRRRKQRTIIQLRPPSPTPESNRHRYSRLCGQG